MARGLMWPHERVHALWAEVTTRAPYHYAAHAAAPQYWCEKWAGSGELMYAFAEESAAAAPPGALLSALRLKAILEEGGLRKHAVYADDRTTRAIAALIADIAPAPADHPTVPEARHLPGWMPRQQRRFGEAWSGRRRTVRLRPGCQALRTAAHARRGGGYDPSRTRASRKRPKNEGCRT